MALPWLSSSKFPRTRRISEKRTTFWGKKPESSGNFFGDLSNVGNDNNKDDDFFGEGGLFGKKGTD